MAASTAENESDFNTEEEKFNQQVIKTFLSRHTHDSIMIYVAKISDEWGTGQSVWASLTLSDDGTWFWNYDKNASFSSVPPVAQGRAHPSNNANIPSVKLEVSISEFLFNLFCQNNIYDLKALQAAYSYIGTDEKACPHTPGSGANYQYLSMSASIIPAMMSREDLWVIHESKRITERETPLTAEECYYEPKKIRHLMERCKDESLAKTTIVWSGWGNETVRLRIEVDCTEYSKFPSDSASNYKYCYCYLVLYHKLNTVLNMYNRAEQNETFQLHHISPLHLENLKKEFGIYLYN